MNYIFKEIRPKDGVMRDIHNEVLGRRCYIIDLQIGQSAWIKYEPEYDPGNFHTLHTSVVENWMEGDEWVTIETENTVYVLELIRKRGESCDLFG